jgi:hypothetical protein
VSFPSILSGGGKFLAGIKVDACGTQQMIDHSMPLSIYSLQDARGRLFVKMVGGAPTLTNVMPVRGLDNRDDSRGKGNTGIPTSKRC